MAVLASAESSPGAKEQARQEYRSTLARVLSRLQEGEANPYFAFPGRGADGFYPPDRFDALIPIRRDKVTFAGLKRDGVGLPAVGRISSAGPNAPAPGYHVPVTAVAIPRDKASSAFDVRLADPERLSELRTPLGEFPVAMNLQAVLDRVMATGPRFGSGLGYLLKAYRFREPGRLIFLQPYDPMKTPVVFVHGLMSTPRMWQPVVEGLLADKTIRSRYQFWFFYYPTGQPVPLSALQLRDALDAAMAGYHVKRPMILVGHSMGGLLSRAQVSRIGLNDAETILPNVAKLPADSVVRRALVFEPRKDVRQVIFLNTPHRGSGIASGGIVQWASGLIRLPSVVASELAPLGDLILQENRGRLPTSIHGLSPRSRFLAALNSTSPTVPVHSVIGASDRIVPYSSSHIEGAESELIVPGGHGSFASWPAIEELRRILDADAKAGN